MTDRELMQKAEKARENAYAPYSHFLVGAALLATDGRVFLGTNVENASFGATSCAERNAIFAAISAGVQEFCSIAIVGGEDGKTPSFCSPCGICRQVLSEFCEGELRVLLGNADDFSVYTLAELLPFSFGKEVIS